MIDFENPEVIDALHEAGWIKPPPNHVLIEEDMLRRLALQIMTKDEVARLYVANPNHEEGS